MERSYSQDYLILVVDAAKAAVPSGNNIPRGSSSELYTKYLELILKEHDPMAVQNPGVSAAQLHQSFNGEAVLNVATATDTANATTYELNPPDFNYEQSFDGDFEAMMVCDQPLGIEDYIDMNSGLVDLDAGEDLDRNLALFAQNEPANEFSVELPAFENRSIQSKGKEIEDIDREALQRCMIRNDDYVMAVCHLVNIVVNEDETSLKRNVIVARNWIKEKCAADPSFAKSFHIPTSTMRHAAIEIPSNSSFAFTNDMQQSLLIHDHSTTNFGVNNATSASMINVRRATTTNFGVDNARNATMFDDMQCF